MSINKKLILRYIIVSAMGVLLHFVYEWSGKNPAVGIFSPVNESTWEHLKLLFFPMLALTIWDVLRNSPLSENFIQARTLGIFCGIMFIVIAFYTVKGVLGKSIDFISILIYFLGVAVAFWTEKKYYDKATATKISSYTSVAFIVLTAVLFAVLTFNSPNVGIFYNPSP